MKRKKPIKPDEKQKKLRDEEIQKMLTMIGEIEGVNIKQTALDKFVVISFKNNNESTLLIENFLQSIDEILIQVLIMLIKVYKRITFAMIVCGDYHKPNLIELDNNESEEQAVR